MNEDFTEAAKFAVSLSTMAHGTSYQGLVEKYIASVNFIFEK